MAWLAAVLVISALISLFVIAIACSGMFGAYRVVVPGLGQQVDDVRRIPGGWGRAGIAGLALCFVGILLLIAAGFAWGLWLARGANGVIAVLLGAAGLTAAIAGNAAWQLARIRRRQRPR